MVESVLLLNHAYGARQTQLAVTESVSREKLPIVGKNVVLIWRVRGVPLVFVRSSGTARCQYEYLETG